MKRIINIIDFKTWRFAAIATPQRPLPLSILAGALVCSAAHSHAVSLTGFGGGLWQASDSTIGVAGFTIEDFEDTTLSPGLQISMTASTADFAATSTLPRVFDPVLDDPNPADFFVPGLSDANKLLLNRKGPIPLDYNSDPGSWADVHFHFASGVTSFGVSIFNADFGGQILVNDIVVGSVPGGSGRNGYFRLDAGAGETIFKVTIANSGNLDALAFDHVAYKSLASASVPDAGGTLCLLGMTALTLGGLQRRLAASQ